MLGEIEQRCVRLNVHVNRYSTLISTEIYRSLFVYFVGRVTKMWWIIAITQISLLEKSQAKINYDLSRLLSLGHHFIAWRHVPFIESGPVHSICGHNETAIFLPVLFSRCCFHTDNDRNTGYKFSKNPMRLDF